MQFDTIWHDIRHSLRTWRARPGVYGVAVLALALGIGANTTIFSVVQTVLLRSLPYAEPDRIVAVFAKSPKKDISRYFLSSSDYFDFAEQSRTLQDFGGFWRNEMNITGASQEPERVAGVSITPGLLTTLGIQMLAGRPIAAEEAKPGAPDAAVITWEFWQRHYGSDLSILGKPIGINGQPVTVVGILPPGIHFAGDAQVWNTLRPYRPRPTPRFMEAIARLRPGATQRQAQAEIDTITRSIAASYPDTNADWGVEIRSLPRDLTGDTRPAINVLFASVGLLLLIACVNVANLLLAEASARSREVAVRAALGAGAGRLARQFLTESLMLSGAGACAGLFLALGGVRAVRALGPASVPRIHEVAVDIPVLFYTLAISIAAALLFGMAPVIRARRPDLTVAMRSGSRSSTGGVRELLGRRVLVIAQVTLAVILVNAASLLIKSFVRLTNVNPGFRTEHVVLANVSLPNSRYRKLTDTIAVFDRILAAARSIPGVRDAGTTTSLPLGADLDYRVPFRFLSQPAPKHLEDQTAWHRMVSSGFFRAMGTPLLAGRDFTDHDDLQSPPVAIINETLARQYWPSGSPIGQKIRGASGGFGPLGAIRVKDPEVIGVVADIKYAGLAKGSEPAIYFSSRQAPFYNVTLVMRTADQVPPEACVGFLRTQLHNIDPELPLAHVSTMTEHVAESIAQPRFQALLLGAFSSLALLLGAVGIYGVLSYTVASRSREIGIRTALGGRPRDILNMILGQGFRLVAYGLILGIAASLATGSLLKKLLFEVRPADWTTYSACCLLLVGVGLLAGYLPARAAAATEPASALRME